jgi:hypothetical protein
MKQREQAEFQKMGRRLPYDEAAHMLRSEIDFSPVPQIGARFFNFLPNIPLVADFADISLPLIRMKR